MIKILFVAHDPGGFDVIFPIYKNICESGYTNCRLILLGPAAEKAPDYCLSKDIFLKEVSEYFTNEQKGILVTGTSWNNDSELLAIKECKQKGIKTISILDFWSNYKARFCLPNKEMVYPDYFWVMDNKAKKEAEEDGINSNIIYIVGQPGLDAYINASTISSRGKNRILFLSQPLSDLYGNTLGYTEFDATEDVITVFREQKILVDIKFHSKETKHYLERFASYKVEGNVTELLSRYDTIIGMNTMGLLQCALMGVCVISYQPGLRKKDLCITNQLGITQGAFSREELKIQIENREKYVFPQKKQWIWSDGKSTERCLDLLMRILADIEQGE